MVEVANNNTPLLNDWAMRGTCGGNANFLAFADSAGVRGDGVGASVAGVLGVSDNHVGVIGFTTGDGPGVLGRATGTNGTGVVGVGPGLANGWAGYFSGRGYFAGKVGIGAMSPSTELEVVGKTRTQELQVTAGAAAGHVMTSDGAGNATWQPAPVQSTPAYFVSGYGQDPSGATKFLTPTVTVTITAGQSIFVTAHKAFGSTAAGGAGNLNLFIGYRQAGSGATPSTVGSGIFGNRVPQNTRFTFGLSAVISGLAAGSYEVGMVGTDAGTGNWNSNEYSYVTALVLN